LALVSKELFIDLVEMLDQRIDTRLVEPEGLHLGEDVPLKFFRLALLRGRQPFALQLTLNVDFLQAAEPLEVIRDVIEGLQHLRFELGLRSTDRKPLLHIVFVDIALADYFVALWRSIANWFADRTALRGPSRYLPRSFQFGAPIVRKGIARNVVPSHRHRFNAKISSRRIQVDDITQKNLAAIKLFAPDADSLKCE
jgi:hypothetical protein